MTQKAKEWSPRGKARLAGVFETLEGLTSTFGQVFVSEGLSWLAMLPRQQLVF
jgi:hypothetical protein